MPERIEMLIEMHKEHREDMKELRSDVKDISNTINNIKVSRAKERGIMVGITSAVVFAWNVIAHALGLK
jgi:hypothetical protein